MNWGMRRCALATSVAALLFSQAAYGAPIVNSTQIDPLVSLSILGTSASLAALCAGSTAAVAAGTAAQASPVAGCVLPVTAAPPPPAVAEAAPPAAEMTSAPGMGTLPLLLGLAAIIGISTLLVSNGNNGNGNITPISPA